MLQVLANKFRKLLGCIHVSQAQGGTAVKLSETLYFGSVDDVSLCMLKANTGMASFCASLAKGPSMPNPRSTLTTQTVVNR
jgi:hypothetical protein